MKRVGPLFTRAATLLSLGALFWAQGSHAQNTKARTSIDTIPRQAGDTTHRLLAPGDTGQGTNPARDTARDSTRKLRPDSIQARFAGDTPLPTLDIGEPYTFTRDQLFASGALTITDLLNRIPSITTFAAGWLPSPQVAAYAGDMSRIRIFYDGIEMDNLEPRNGQVMDLSSIPIWSLETLTIRRGANDLQIDMHSWEYNSTTPYTRVDVLTGDLNTNLYRAFYGKRYYNGTGLQIAGQQYGTINAREGGGGDQTSLFGRYGIARKMWSVDATVNRTNSTRTITSRYENGVYQTSGEALPDYREGNTFAYLRGVLGHAGDGPFLQLLASTQSIKETSSHFNATTAAPYLFPPDTVDSAASLSQYVATAGLDRGSLRLRLTDRYRVQQGIHSNAGLASTDLSEQYLSASASAERDPYYGFTRLEADARVSPLPFLAISGYLGRRDRDGAPLSFNPAAACSRFAVNQGLLDLCERYQLLHFPYQPNERSARLEGGVRLFHGVWLSAGIINRDTALLVPPTVFDSGFKFRPVGSTTGTIVSFRGPLAYGFSVDAEGTNWANPTVYVPNFQSHVELRYFTNLLSRFPEKNFSFLLATTMDYRSKVAFPVAADSNISPFFGTGRVYSILAEIRILRGTITYQRRNSGLLVYDQVPGYIMPPAVNIYGVRWYFFD